MKLSPAIALLALSCVASAGQREEYGYAWTLELDAGRAAHRLTLTEGVYARIGDRELRDLEAFDAQGMPVPFGPVPPASGTTATPTGEFRAPLPWFALPRERNDAAGEVGISIERDAQGHLRRIGTEVDVASRDDDAATDFLIDASSAVGTVEELDLAWEAAPKGNVSAHFEVLGSDDFEQWYGLVAHASLIDLRQGEFRLTRRTIALPSNSARYLKLVRLDAGAPFVLGAVGARLWVPGNGTVSTADREWSKARYLRSTRDPAAYLYQAIGPLPVERIALRLASPNSVSMLTVQSRDDDDAPWTTHSEFTAFRIEAGTRVLDHDDLAIGYTRDRQWRVVASPPLDRPPSLRVGYRPDQFAVLERGPAPWSLAAGSATTRRQDYPMAALLGALDAGLGREWELATARLTSPIALRGDRALHPPPPPRPLKLWALWAVLAIGVIAVVWMVLGLLRSPPAPS